MSRSDPAIFFIFMIVGGLYAYWKGLNQYALKKAIEYTATSKAVAVAPGLAELSGEAHPYGTVVVSPYAKKECVYYRTELYKWSGSGKSRHRSLVKSFESNEPIYVEDDTGLVLVEPTLKPVGPRTKVGVEEDRHAKKMVGTGIFGSLLGREQDKSSRMYRFVSEFAPDYKSYGDDLEVHETFIEDGDPIYVLGTAKLYEKNAKNPQMVIWDDPKNKYFCISDGSEKDALSIIRFDSTFFSLGGPLLSLAGYLLLLARFKISSYDAVFFGVTAVIALYIWLALTVLVAMYNGLIQLRNNLEKADANIQVLLKKRSDLIPELVEVVKSYAKYERELQEELAGLRSLPIGEDSKRLIAIAEKYPELMAKEGFLMFQQQMSKVENQIMASRSFYNDSARLYNSQIESFPYLLFASKMGLTSIPYLKFAC